VLADEPQTEGAAAIARTREADLEHPSAQPGRGCRTRHGKLHVVKVDTQTATDAKPAPAAKPAKAAAPAVRFQGRLPAQPGVIHPARTADRQQPLARVCIRRKTARSFAPFSFFPPPWNKRASCVPGRRRATLSR
jgi:hypothetical protein